MKNVALFFIVYLGLGSCSPKEQEWVALGDSITYLNDHADETGNRITRGYMTRVVEALPHMRYTNKGYNGWTAGDVAREIENLDLAKADMYTVFLGTNDWWRGNPLGTIDDYQKNTGADTFFGSYGIIIDKLRTLNKDARFILITPMQRVDFIYIGDMKNNAYGSYKEKNGQSLSEFANAVVEIGKSESFPVVDLFNQSGMTHENMVRYKRLKDPQTGTYKDFPYPDFINVPFDPEKDEYPYPPEATHMTYDGLHPSDEGYEVISRMLIEVIEK